MLYNVTHSLCDDGLASAWVMRSKYPKIQTIFDYHDGAWKKTQFKEGDFIYFTDISPLPKDSIDYIINKGADFFVYDHHETALQELKSFFELGGDRSIESKFNIKMGDCGAVLTWRNMFPNEKLPRILSYIDIADLWKWEKDSNALPICRYIRHNVNSNNVDSFQNLVDNIDFEKAIVDGKLLLEQVRKQMNKILFNKMLVDFDGTKLLVVNDSLYGSELGHELAIESPSKLGMTYYIMKDGIK